MRYFLPSVCLAFALFGHATAAGWIEANGPNGTGSVNSIFVAGDDIYLGARAGKVFRSSDDGATWSSGSRGLPKDCYPEHFCISGDAVFMNCRSSGGVYRSRDHGAGWERADSGIAHPSVNSLAAYGGDIFAGTSDSLYRSSDQGAHWASLPSGLPDPQGYSILGANDAGLFALFGTYGLRRSSNRGVTWETADAGLEKEFPECLALADGALYLGSNRPTGIFRSLDNGRSWKKYAAGYVAYGPHWLARGSEGLLALSSDKLYRLPPGDSVWSQAPNRTESSGPYGFAAHGSKVFMGRETGLYRKDGIQGDWIQVTQALATAEADRLAWMDGELYASSSEGAFRSRDAGATWSQLRDSDGSISGWSSFAGLGKVRLACCADSTVLRSTDGGATWKAAIQGLPADKRFSGLIAVPPYGIVNTSQGFYRTEDSGLTWIPSYTGMTGTAPGLFANQGMLVAGNLQGVYLSDDGGKSWAKQPFFELYDATTTAYVEPYVFAATGHGIFRARVGSDSVVKISVSYGNPSCFAYGEGRLFAGMFGGVYETRDFGSTWALLDTAWVPSDGTSTPSIYDLDFKDGWLYAGTAGRGVWKYPVSDTVTVGLRSPGAKRRLPAGWDYWRRKFDARGVRIEDRRDR